MKVPNQVVGNVRPVSRVSNYLRADGASPEAFGAGIGRALVALSGELEQRQGKIDRFGALRDFTNFQSGMSERLVEFKRTAPPDARGFGKQVGEFYDREASKFLQENVPAELRPEFEYQLANSRTNVISDALEFQYKAGDATFRQGVNEIYQKSLTALDPTLGGDPAQLEKQRALTHAAIDATDLSDIEKAELKRNVAAGLEGVTYKQVVKRSLERGAVNLPSSIGGVIDEAAARYGQDAKALRTIAWLESRGNPSAQNPNSSAGGLFQFIDKTARAYGLKNKMDAAESADAGARLLRDNREGLKKTLGREPTVGELYLAHQQGLSGARALLGNPDRLAVDVVGYDAVRLNGGAPGMTAGQFAQLWTKKAGDANPDLDNSPAFSNLAYEDRLALRRDAETEFNKESAELAAQRKYAVDTQVNGLLAGIATGSKGAMDRDKLIQQGVLTDYDSINKVNEALKKYQGDQQAAVYAAGKLASGRAFDPTSDDDRKGLNAFVKASGGLQSLEQGDSDYVQNGLIPLAQASGDLPTDVSGLLQGMARSQNATQALFALESLRMLRDAAPDAYLARVPERLQQDVDYYAARKNTYPPEQLLSMVNGGGSYEERQRRNVLEKEAKDYLAQKKEGVSTLSTLVAEVVSGAGGFFSSAQPVKLASYAKALDMDYQVYFTDAYTRLGDVEEADAAARAQLTKVWAVTSVDGQNTLMKYPPEKMGYKPIAGSYDWIGAQVRAEHGMAEGDQFQLISDGQTWSEYQKWQQGKGPPPSYQVIVFGEDGPRLSTVGRSYFEPTVEDKAADERAFIKQNVERDLMEAEARLMEAEFFYGSRGEPVPQEFIDERNKLKELYEPTVPEPPKRPQAEWMSEGVEPMAVP